MRRGQAIISGRVWFAGVIRAPLESRICRIFTETLRAERLMKFVPVEEVKPRNKKVLSFCISPWDACEFGRRAKEQRWRRSFPSSPHCCSWRWRRGPSCANRNPRAVAVERPPQTLVNVTRRYCPNAAWCATYGQTTPHFDLSKLNPCLCTHIVYGTLQIKGDLSLGPFRHGNLTALNSLRRRNRRLVPMVELRGLDHVEEVPTEEQLVHLAQQVSRKVAPTGPRGLDVDYQLHGVDYQVAMEQRPVLGQFLHHFRRETPIQHPVVTVTVAKEPHLVNHAYDFRMLVKNADHVNPWTTRTPW
ncbi:hypothetical protein MRX96_033198 [Rhipicephalus microplus]